MDVLLTPELEKFVAEQISSGLYNSATEVMIEALRLLKQHDELRQNQAKKGDKLPAALGDHPQQKSQGVRPLGQDRGLFTVPEDFNAPLPEEILAAFEASSQ